MRVKSLTDAQWGAEITRGMPQRWRSRLLARHAEQLAAAESLPSGRGLVTKAVGEANQELAALVGKLTAVRLTLDAPDDEICARAEEFAAAALELGRLQTGMPMVRAAMASFCRTCGVEPPAEKVEDAPAVRRMACRLWWRRALRKLHAKAVEGAAITLGYVHRASDLYVSNESLARRLQQVRRNTAMMEGVTLENELEQRFTLAELAAKGTGNKVVRRNELMTRISGFDEYAHKHGHDGLFLTITCPSRMHKWVQVGNGQVRKNENYDETTPREAQRYLSKVWAKTRAAFKRAGVAVYGFRIAEPHHDGCPHWHLLLFVEPVQLWDVVDVVKRYALQDSPDEPGAWRHRVEAVRIDSEGGSAAGYVAKYVAKNIDGVHVDGMPVDGDMFAGEAARRVEAWAATWGIRQFQQIGGAPVGVWREFRRIKELPEGVPEHVRQGWEASNRTEGEEDASGWGKCDCGGEREGGTDVCAGDGVPARRANFANYVEAQGGAFIGKNYRIRLAKEESQEEGRYGEPIGARPVGVSAWGLRDVLVCGLPGKMMSEWLVRSVRYTWTVVKGGGMNACSDVVRVVHKAVGAAVAAVGAGVGAALDGVEVLGALARPRTGVNNCTPHWEGLAA